MSKAEWLALVRAGLHGGREGFARQVNKLISRLAVADPEMAAALQGELARNPALRGVQANPVDADSRLRLLHETYPVLLPLDPVWSDAVADSLARVVAEWRGATRLREAGMTPTRSLLLSGPPGVGKTLAAHWLAMQLEVPLFTLDLATMMNSYLGKTGQNLRLVLDYAMSTRSVLLLDEFDAIAKRRDDDADVGELKRLVNVLLQAVDNWTGESLLVAATNHAALLDPAVWRRFDVALTLGVPEPAMTRNFLEMQGVGSADLMEVARLVEGESFAHVERWLRAARKDVLLHNVPFLGAVVAAVARDRGDSAPGKVARDLQIWTLHQQGKSAREIGRLIGVSHPTVQSVIRRFKGAQHGEK